MYGRNLAPVDRCFIPLFIGFQPSFWCRISHPSTVLSYAWLQITKKWHFKTWMLKEVARSYIWIHLKWFELWEATDLKISQGQPCLNHPMMSIGSPTGRKQSPLVRLDSPPVKLLSGGFETRVFTRSSARVVFPWHLWLGRRNPKRIKACPMSNFQVKMFHGHVLNELLTNPKSLEGKTKDRLQPGVPGRCFRRNLNHLRKIIPNTAKYGWIVKNSWTMLKLTRSMIALLFTFITSALFMFPCLNEPLPIQSGAPVYDKLVSLYITLISLWFMISSRY